MTKKSKVQRTTVINFILDESGSMSSITESVISGFNEYIDNLKKQGKFKFTLTKFDSTGIRTPYIATALSNVKPLDHSTYQPGQNTPLYDAVCETIIEVEKEVADNTPVLVVIMTDGQENASKEYTQVQLNEMIKRLQAKGNWTFVFLGANQDSWLIAEQFGIKKGNIMNWQATEVGTKNVFRGVAMASAAYSENANLGQLSTSSYFADAGIDNSGSGLGVTAAATTLGSRGGQKTATRGSDYYRQIGDLGRQSRYKK